MRGKKIIIVLIILAIVAVVTVLILRKRKNNSSSSNSSGNRTSSGNSGNSSSVQDTQGNAATITGGNDNFPLRYGSRGTRVRGLQYIINGVSGNSSLLTVDGIWGKKTDAAVKQYIARTGSINYNEWETFVPLWNKYKEALKKDREFASNNNGMQLGTAILAMAALKRKLPVN